MTLYTSTSPNPESLATRCVDVLEVLGGKAMEKYGRFIVALAGGSTPRGIYAQWARQTRLDWSKVVILFGDERCVPPDDEDSNYHMAAQALLSTLPQQPQVIRMEGENRDPAQAALNYDHALRELLGDDGAIHVALLGVGTDGHTASLFPGMPALREQKAWCVATPSPGGTPNSGTHRITLTLPCLRAVSKLMFLAAGESKSAVMHRVLEGPLHPEQLPAQFFLRDDRLNVNLLMDEAAAAKLIQVR